MKVLLAVDGSPYTRRMLEFLGGHEGFLTGSHEFTAVTSLVPITPHARGYLARSVVDDYYQSTAAEIFAPVAEFARNKGWSIAEVSRVGNAADTIADVAADGRFDLIVMGSHGHSPVVGALLGSVTSRVIARVRIPVLIIR
ncbi:MAG: universal stress protein [Lautropia sp.]